MNACEKMQIARMNLRAGRGRSIEYLTEEALRQLRRTRKADFGLFSVEVIDITGLPVLCNNTNSLHQARFWQLRIMQKGVTCAVFDNKTGIQIY